MGRQFAAGISIEAFVWAGFTVWLLYSQVMSGARQWRSARPPPFPGVTAMHMRLANAAWSVIEYAVFLYLSVFVLIIFGDNIGFPDVVLTMSILLLAAMLGLGFGLLLGGLSRVVPAVDPLMHMFAFLVFLSSGLYYSSATAPLMMIKIFLFNPMLHLIEYERYAFDPGYPVYLVSLWYPTVFAAGLLVFGLVVTRRLRYTVAV
jgi:capsular polysaccharide transport system permease protein